MKKILKSLTLTIILLIFLGCSSQGRKQQQNFLDDGIAELGAAKTVESKPHAEEKSLEGMTICIDPGHGKTSRLSAGEKEPVAPGSNEMKAAIAAGTTGVVTGVTEESLNLTVALKLKEALASRGAKPVMVRETHECGLTNVERAKLWNLVKADLTIRIHANGVADSTVSGVLMMIPGDRYIKDTAMLEKSSQAGKYVLECVLRHTGARSSGTVRSTDMTGFNWSKVPVILLEMGFMTNPEEDRLLNTGEYQDKIVSGIVEGVEKYKGYTDKVKY